MVLWIIAIILTIIFLGLLSMVWLRKLQFDAVHRNFLALEDKFGGRVARAGFAVRPRYTGIYKGQKISISITSEGGKNGRKYYIATTMQATSRVNFTIMSTDWLERREFPPEKARNTIALLNRKYLLEVTHRAQLKKLNIKKIEEIVSALHPFAYILIAKTAIILERISTNIIKDTEFHSLYQLIEELYALRTAVES